MNDSTPLTARVSEKAQCIMGYLEIFRFTRTKEIQLSGYSQEESWEAFAAPYLKLTGLVVAKKGEQNYLAHPVFLNDFVNLFPFKKKQIGQMPRAARIRCKIFSAETNVMAPAGST